MLSLLKSHKKGSSSTASGKETSREGGEKVRGVSAIKNNIKNSFGSVIGSKNQEEHNHAFSSGYVGNVTISTGSLRYKHTESILKNHDPLLLQTSTSTDVSSTSLNLGDRPPSTAGDRPPSRNRQPRLGISSSQQQNYTIFEDNHMEKFKNQQRGVLPRTSPNQAPRGYSPNMFATHHQTHRRPKDALPPPPTTSNLFEDDPGIMSEAETASTTRSRSKGKSRVSFGSMSLGRSSRIRGGQYPGDTKQHVLSSTLYEEDPGIMSEAETASTSSKGRRRHQKYDLPVVRTPSKTLERPLGMVFLIYRGETKRAILPNEITSVITVKALFVRSFSKILTMDYMDSPRVKIYIHDSSKDIFYELENLSEIKDRTILKVFEVDSSGRGPSGLGATGLPPITNSDEVPPVPAIASHTAAPPLGSEPDYIENQSLKGSKTGSKKDLLKQSSLSNRPASVAGTASSTLPRNAFSSLDQSMAMINAITSANPLISSKSTKGGSNRHLNNIKTGQNPDGQYDFDEANARRIMPRFSTSHSHSHGRIYPGPANTEEAKARMMHMEAQLNQLTGMVERALKNKKLGKKQVSFDKTVTYNDDQPPSILATSKRHQHMHYHSKSLQVVSSSSSSVPPDQVHGHLKRLHRTTKELKQEVRVLRRLTQLQSMAMKDLVQDTYLKLREACINFSANNGIGTGPGNSLEFLRVAQDEETYSKELTNLLKDLASLETTVEEVRSGVINKKSKISLQDVETMAISLNKCTKSVTHLRQAFPTLEANLKIPTSESNRQKESSLVAEFLKKANDSLDNAWRRCKKLTGTLITLRRLASVQEQRFHPSSGSSIDLSLSPTPNSEQNKSSAPNTKESNKSLDELLDALQVFTTPAHPGPVDPPQKQMEQGKSLEEISKSTTSKSPSPPQVAPKPLTAKVRPQAHLDTLDSNSSGSKVNSQDTGKPPPPCPPPRTTPGLSTKAAPPPPPPRTSSTHKSSRVSSSIDSSSSSSSSGQDPSTISLTNGDQSTSTSTSDVKIPPAVAPKPEVGQLNMNVKQDMLESRHQELLVRQKQLQEQYQRLQEMQKKSSNSVSNGTVTLSAKVTESQSSIENDQKDCSDGVANDRPEPQE